jgi:hypothetical protein
MYHAYYQLTTLGIGHGQQLFDAKVVEAGPCIVAGGLARIV